MSGLRRPLCWLGYHSWRYTGEVEHRERFGCSWSNARCARCGREEWFGFAAKMFPSQLGQSSPEEPAGSTAEWNPERIFPWLGDSEPCPTPEEQAAEEQGFGDTVPVPGSEGEEA